MQYWPALTILLTTGCVTNVDELLDRDNDGFGSVEGDCRTCTDCDDSDASVNPAAEEVCDGVDNDCDGDIDGDAGDRNTYYVDEDGDGFGVAEVRACELPDGAALQAGDCDDGAATVKPGGAEVCDGVDNDCDGAVDVGAVDGVPYFPDNDADGFGGPTSSGSGCTPPAGTASNSLDCDDDDATANPDGVDVPYNGIDEDCDDGDLVDVDGDGEAGTQVGGDDCDDSDPAVWSTASESWLDGFTDNNCDGSLDTPQHTYGSSFLAAPQPSSVFGVTLVPLGDIDGDGDTEFLTGAPTETVDATRDGAVYLVDHDGTQLVEHRLAAGLGADSFLGVTGAADVTGDGLLDVLVSDVGGPSAVGSVFLISGADIDGGPLDLQADAEVVFDGTEVGARFGNTNMAFVGDLDGDGLDEVAVGAQASVDFTNEGALYIFDGGTTTDRTADDADRVYLGGYDGADFGGVPTAAGDQNSDGHDDVWVTYGEGNVAVIIDGTSSGGFAQDAALHRLAESSGSEDNHKKWLIGDVDGDGRRDMATSRDEEGFRIWVGLHDDPVRVTDDPHWLVSLQTGSFTGQTVSLPDRDGDGLDELLFPCTYHEPTTSPFLGIMPGSSLDIGGSASLVDAPLTAVSDDQNDGYGWRGAFLGDVDGDGIDDVGLASTSDGIGGITLLAVP